MTVKRIEWTCPQCEKRYAIPAHRPKPTLCPACVNNTAEDGPAREPAPVIEPPEASEPVGIVAEPQPAADDEMPSFPSFDEPRPGVLPPISPKETPHRSRRTDKKYPALRFISQCYKALAILVFLIGCAGLVFSVYSAIVNEANELRTALILSGIYVLFGSFIPAISLRAVAELIQVVIDIEENTRRHSSEDD